MRSRISVGVLVAGVSALVACSPGHRPGATPGDGDVISCGQGTVQVGDECLPAPSDAGPSDGRQEGPPITCGPGTVLDDDECLPAPSDAGLDAGIPDAAGDALPADAAPIDAAPDADPAGTEATSFAIDPAHDNAQPTDTVASPLTPLWTASFGGPVSYPLVVGGLVIVSAAESQPNVRALDIHTGSLVWGPIVFGTAVSLAYDGGRVFALDRDGHLTALDAATGAHIWAVQVQGEPFYWSPPVAAGGRVYVNGLGSGGETVAIDEQTGTELWYRGTFDGSDGCVAVAGSVVYEAEACDHLTAWNAQTGTQLWFHAGNCTGGGGAAPAAYGGMIWERDWAEGNIIVDSSGTVVGSFAGSVIPAFHAGTVFYQASGTVSAVDIATDTLRWSFTGDGQLCTSPVVAGGGGQVFVGSMSGKVYELDEATGVQRSVADVGAMVTCFSEHDSMALAEGHLLVPAGDQLVVY